MPGVILSLAIHNHQPVGNFPKVFETAYTQSYLPMVQALERHPAIRVALHYSGPLLDWLEQAHPEFFPLVRRLVERGQVELMTGGYYEPILAIIPDRDKLGQIQKMTAYLRRRFRTQPVGLWLAERIWEPHLAKPIAQSGVQYTIVDDTHFVAAGLRHEELTGYFVTEEQGALLKIFPSHKRLRYLIPWQSPGDVIAYLRSFSGSGNPVLLMGDDGEKFGLWPGTYAHCWEQGWVEAFFHAVETEASWLAVLPPGEAAALPATGRVYLPTASYDEMGEWALPAEKAAAFAQIRSHLEASGEPAVHYLRGGYWRHFLVKYPEINTMHKKMLRVSQKVHRMPPGRRRQRALDELWQGQCNCPYWHGVFGGVYLPHIRRANFAHLIAADALAEGALRPGSGQARSRPRATVEDLDGDGSDEVEIASKAMSITVDPADGGSVVEWDWHRARINLVNVLTRRFEGYHQQLQEAVASAQTAAGAVESIHTTRVRVKERGLEELLIYDGYRRASFLDHVLDPSTTLDAFYRCRYAEKGDSINQAYAAMLVDGRGRVAVRLMRDGRVWVGGDQVPVRIEKRFSIDGRTPTLMATYRVAASERPIDIIFGVETNWAITDSEARVSLAGDRRPARTVRSVDSVERIEFTDAGWDGAVVLEMPAATVWVHPLETVSNSEGGFERTMQGVTCLCIWRVARGPSDAWEAKLTVTLSPG